MEIKTTHTNSSGKVLEVHYRDINSEFDFKDKKISGVHAYCFYKDKLVVVYSQEKEQWTPPGGGVDEYEDVREAVRREVFEETNMKVVKQRFIGYQELLEPKKIISQTRSVCIVEPYGDFVADPDGGEITKIELIDPKDYKKYFDWGDIGDRLMVKALEMKTQMQAEQD